MSNIFQFRRRIDRTEKREKKFTDLSHFNHQYLNNSFTLNHYKMNLWQCLKGSHIPHIPGWLIAWPLESNCLNSNRSIVPCEAKCSVSLSLIFLMYKWEHQWCLPHRITVMTWTNPCNVSSAVPNPRSAFNETVAYFLNLCAFAPEGIHANIERAWLVSKEYFSLARVCFAWNTVSLELSLSDTFLNYSSSCLLDR